MACPRCGFHNIPGKTACVVCQAPLGGGARAPAATAVLTPPRAPGWRKVLRRVTRPIDSWFSQRRPRSGGEPWDRALLGLVPGLAQFRRGNWRSGGALAGGWSILMVVAIVFYGSVAGMLALGLALSAHLTSALLPHTAALAGLPFGRRLGTTLFGLATLLACIYLPLYGVADRYYFTLQMTALVTPGEFLPGDLVVFRRQDPPWRPTVGTLVAYRGANGQRLFDRVLGLPGDRITRRDGVLARNGRPIPASAYPLSPDTLPASLDVVVPPGRVYIWPAARINNVNYALAASQLLAWAVVDLVQLEGQAVRIAAPLERRRSLAPPLE